ncbi:hypothetical protein IVW58_13325 [Salmonella enterica subsp. enterica serovar Worthington]|nr:hypothetical protein [Salmonella enterica subsp. enterica serovar Worthington]MBP1523655.1 hypothetical protein [Salmonella enterica subsp. enterica serovar Worthington]
MVRDKKSISGQNGLIPAMEYLMMALRLPGPDDWITRPDKVPVSIFGN